MCKGIAVIVYEKDGLLHGLCTGVSSHDELCKEVEELRYGKIEPCRFELLYPCNLTYDRSLDRHNGQGIAGEQPEPVLWEAAFQVANPFFMKHQKEQLQNAYLEGANLFRANLDGAKLEGANLEEANLEGANLDGANLFRANLDGANLEGANLYGANLFRANLEGANLEGANLEGANLKWANLKRANLEEANLKGANLEGANLKVKCSIACIINFTSKEYKQAKQFIEGLK